MDILKRRKGTPDKVGYGLNLDAVEILRPYDEGLEVFWSKGAYELTEEKIGEYGVHVIGHVLASYLGFCDQEVRTNGSHNVSTLKWSLVEEDYKDFGVYDNEFKGSDAMVNLQLNVFDGKPIIVAYVERTQSFMI